MIVITDVHGCYLTMLELIKRCKAKYPDKEIVIAGDLADRGPRSKEVIQYCIDNNIKVVRGNHEQIFIDEAPRLRFSGLWALNGGKQCYDSYCEDVYVEEWAESDIPKPKRTSPLDNWKKQSDTLNHWREVDTETMLKHKEWMKTLPYYLEFPDCKNDEGRYLVVSHSCITNIWDNRDQKDNPFFKQHCLWNRNTGDWIDNPEIFNVFGHTPQEGGPWVTKGWACIDTGACFNSIGYRCLTALVYPEMDFIYQQTID